MRDRPSLKLIGATQSGRSLLGKPSVMRGRWIASGSAALVLVALIAGCRSSPERPTGRFVYSSHLATPNVSRLYAINADGKGLHKVTRGLARVGESDPDWSPDGRRIVFIRTFDCADPVLLCTAAWLVNADGSEERRLTPQTPGRGAISPRWSPDGHRIAYVEYIDHSSSYDIWVMNTDGSDKRRLTRLGDAEEPAWSPDGRQIAFSHDSDIFVLTLGTGSLQRLTKTPTTILESYPDWSPDGKRIAYELNNPTPTGQAFQEYDAYVIDADGTDARRLSKAVDTDAHPVWSSHGTLIAYGSDGGPVTGDEIAIVIVDADSGRRVRRITAPGMDLFPIDWAAD
jgi:Tol biopolymer transport system component